MFADFPDLHSVREHLLFQRWNRRCCMGTHNWFHDCNLPGGGDGKDLWHAVLHALDPPNGRLQANRYCARAREDGRGAQFCTVPCNQCVYHGSGMSLILGCTRPTTFHGNSNLGFCFYYTQTAADGFHPSPCLFLYRSGWMQPVSTSPRRSMCRAPLPRRPPPFPEPYAPSSSAQ